jgi:hypothetical protein
LTYTLHWHRWEETDIHFTGEEIDIHFTGMDRKKLTYTSVEKVGNALYEPFFWCFIKNRMQSVIVL